MKRHDRKRPTESFILGMVALVFLIIGYQTAMFVYRATVKNDVQYVQDTGNPAAEEKKIESFRFNPNTVSVDELCRLGFSRKQAQSIANYREKGGRFRRKSDFAKSFVVSDSIYQRLEPYIDIPLLDLNLADSADFDGLPGIGGWFAAKMIEHRKALKGYSYKEQLMDIWKFDKEKYDALQDLVIVSAKNVTPYPLWTYPADSLCRHPYIRNYEIARAIVLFRENTPKSQWTVEHLFSAGIITSESAEKLARCAISKP